MLKEHLGRWRSEGTFVIGGVSQPAKATWECAAAVKGIGVVCTWHHEWADGRADDAKEIIGYDPAIGALRTTRVTDRGIVTTTTLTVRDNTMVDTWQSTQDGKPLVGSNRIVVVPGGNWTQHMSVDLDGQRVTQMDVTHYRVAK